MKQCSRRNQAGTASHQRSTLLADQPGHDLFQDSTSRGTECSPIGGYLPTRSCRRTHSQNSFGGPGTGSSPVNRAKLGFKQHLICGGNGTPIYVLTSGANVPDINRAIDLLDGYPPVAGRRGRSRRRFDVLLADNGLRQ
ncbi:transposase [Actinoplanes sp. NBRC 103695]|uniref:transposase n=1 Tax=Actinoplanes sp. NBRC 103695 TaxID=3032202 RepID=UPI0024A13C4E|nr:transposase [Actinoplanes sp. NBRC 103695]GLZ02347.1 hypothetical protein Acsp02_95980 [Actinoplanes sp. NBRC 103695]